MKNENPLNCWDYMKCPRDIKEKCEAYKRKLGQECWLVSQDIGTSCYGYNTHKGCNNCPWFIINGGPSW